MMTKKYQIRDQISAADNDIVEKVKDFCDIFKPLEEDILILIDNCTGAYYIECHIHAEVLIDSSTIDVPLDPDDQSEYRANRDIVEDHIAFEQMKVDAVNKRSFSNLVTEYNDLIDLEHPLKIIGGQHRFLAIREAQDRGINECHGIKVYFGLEIEQRLDVQLISNTNIAVSPDLLDRMYETMSGPELRNWCQKVGLLKDDQDFSSKRQKGQQITVRDARTFIINFIEGKNIEPKEFGNNKTTPILPKSGSDNPLWEELKRDNSDLWDDKGLIEAAKQFAKLIIAQRKFFDKKTGKAEAEYAEKVLTYAVNSSWSYVAGVLQKNKKRLKNHYNLSKPKTKDPLNAVALSKGKHRSDPDNYRGLGTRSDAKERGRCTELFFLHAEKNDGIKTKIIDAAIKKYEAKKAMLEAKEAEGKI